MMRTWRYRAVDAGGSRSHGIIAARNEGEIEAQLARGGLALLACRPLRRVRRRRIRRSQLLAFITQLEQLLTAGVPVVEALGDMAASPGDAGLDGTAAELAAAIEAGQTLSDAMAASAIGFDPMHVAMVRVGEQGGRLVDVLGDLGAMLQGQAELAARLKHALVYPLIVLAVLAAVVPFLMIWLVPRLVEFIDAVGGALPPQTVALIAVSGFVSAWWPLLLVAGLGLPAGALTLARISPAFRLWRDAWLLRLWLIGGLLTQLHMARFTHALARLYAAGVAVPRALSLAGDLLANTALAGAVERARAAIDRGETVSDALAGAGLFPPLVVRMTRVGELTGSLDRALDAASRYHARAARETLDRIEPAIQPALTLLLGLLIAWIMLAVLGPVYHSMTAMAF